MTSKWQEGRKEGKRKSKEREEKGKTSVREDRREERKAGLQQYNNLFFDSPKSIQETGNSISITKQEFNGYLLLSSSSEEAKIYIPIISTHTCPTLPSPEPEI